MSTERMDQIFIIRFNNNFVSLKPVTYMDKNPLTKSNLSLKIELNLPSRVMISYLLKRSLDVLKYLFVIFLLSNYCNAYI